MKETKLEEKLSKMTKELMETMKSIKSLTSSIRELHEVIGGISDNLLDPYKEEAKSLFKMAEDWKNAIIKYVYGSCQDYVGDIFTKIIEESPRLEEFIIALAMQEVELMNDTSLYELLKNKDYESRFNILRKLRKMVKNEKG